jgi:bidirectional [NiFe] hydrogenase diaphorase subunit
MDSTKLNTIMEQYLAEDTKFNHVIHVCAGTGCISSKSELVLNGLEKVVKERNLENTVKVKKVGCMGLCAAGPIVAIFPDEIFYKTVEPQDVEEIVDSLDKEPIERLLIHSELPFFTRQHKNALKKSGVVNPEVIEDYIKLGGYSGLMKVLENNTPQEVIDEVSKSGLRGRGGGGFPTGKKWSFVAAAEGGIKYLICNADEGDPGAFMDRSILESDPHLLIEGMVIAAYAVGATNGFVYVRAEYPLAVSRLRKALIQARKNGFLGENIGGTNFAFDIEIRLGAGAFVCGEETALIASLEGERGMPRVRPPYPAQKGFNGYPTLINNVETYANIPAIINKGGDWFNSIGTETSKGTKVFALTGKINNTGLIEVPMGITLRDIVFEIGGGIPDGREFKAIQTGGPSGGCIPESLLDTPVDFESLSALGSIMGSGGMIVMDDTSDMVDVAKFFMEFSMDESCGKCIPCRAGTKKIYEILCKFLEGNASTEDLNELEYLCEFVKESSLCGLGKTAPNPVLSTLKHFRHEYLAKIAVPMEKLEDGGDTTGIPVDWFVDTPVDA